MLSRMADSLYWMSRFLERVDNTARLLDINVLYMLEADEGTNKSVQWEPTLKIVSCNQLFEQTYGEGKASGSQVLRFMTQEKKNPGSLINSLRLARENARVARDRITNEMWEAINEFWLHTNRQLKAPFVPWGAAEFYKNIRQQVARFQGLTHNTMMRGEAYGFTRLGTLLERADMTTRILNVKYHLLLPDTSMVGSPLDYYQWGALLKSLSGFESYRRLYHNGIRPIDVTEFVVLDPYFPRSLKFQVDQMGLALSQIVSDINECHVCDAMNALHQHLQESTPETILENGLHEYLQGFLGLLSDLNSALQSDFFQAHLGEAKCAS